MKNEKCPAEWFETIDDAVKWVKGRKDMEAEWIRFSGDVQELAEGYSIHRRTVAFEICPTAFVEKN